MTDTPPTDIEATGPPADSWRRLALDAVETVIGLLVGLAIKPAADSLLGARRDALLARRDALLAAEDPHPPVFHVRPVWSGVIVRSGKRVFWKGDPDRTFKPAAIRDVTKQWRWGAREANGEIVIPESEPLTHKAHAIAMAHRFADPLGAEVRVADEEGA